MQHGEIKSNPPAAWQAPISSPFQPGRLFFLNLIIILLLIRTWEGDEIKIRSKIKRGNQKCGMRPFSQTRIKSQFPCSPSRPRGLYPGYFMLRTNANSP